MITYGRLLVPPKALKPNNNSFPLGIHAICLDIDGGLNLQCHDRLIISEGAPKNSLTLDGAIEFSIINLVIPLECLDLLDLNQEKF